MARDQQPSSKSNNTKTVDGFSVHDPVFELLDGHEVAALNARQNFSVETRAIAEKLFPYQSSKNQRFSVTFPNSAEIEDFLSAYLTGEGSWNIRRSSRHLYSSHSHLDLAEFFQQVAYLLMTDGVAYFAVEWGTIVEWRSDIILPVHFKYLPASTIKVAIGKEGVTSYTQRFNPLISPDHVDELKGKVITLDASKIFATKYEFGEPPVRLAHDLAQRKQRLSQSRVEKFGASSNIKDMSLRVEQLRHTKQSDLHRQEQIVRAKIRKTFRLPVDHVFVRSGTLDADVTDYYRAYRLIEYLKYLQEFRNYLIKEFNVQVAHKIAEKNSFADLVEVQYVGNRPSLHEIETEYRAFTKEEITFVELVEKLIKH